MQKIENTPTIALLQRRTALQRLRNAGKLTTRDALALDVLTSELDRRAAMGTKILL